MNLQLAELYFCDKTRAALEKSRQIDKNWWEVDDATRLSIMAPMVHELTCSLDLGLRK